MKKDLIKRNLVQKFEMKKLIYECLFRNSQIPTYRYYFLWKKNSISQQASKTQIRNRCILTNRSRGVYSKFRLSRISFRELASAGLLPGVIKSSW